LACRVVYFETEKINR